LEKCNNLSRPVWVEAEELIFCMNMLYFEVFKVGFSDFEVLDVCGGFFWTKKLNH
jgi:hypothetical protein